MNWTLTFLLILVGCQDYNSNTSDRDRFGPSDLEANADFRAAYAVIQTRCTVCHTSSVHANWASYKTSQQWIDSSSNRVIAGDSENSNLVRRIFNSNHTNSNMPENGEELPETEYDAIRRWIDSL